MAELQATSGQTIQIGCRITNGSTYNRLTEIKTFYADSTRSQNYSTDCTKITETNFDCWYNFTFTKPINVYCLWGYRGTELLFEFMIFENEPTWPPICLTPSIFNTGPYIIKNVGQQQILFNPSWSLKRVELALHINISKINSKCTTLLRTAYTGWLAWLRGHSLKQSQHMPWDANDLRKLERPIKSSLLALGANQWLLSDVLPHWEQIEENDHQLIVNALGNTQWYYPWQCLELHPTIISKGEGGTLPNEIQKLIWDIASEFEKEFQAWWQLVNFAYYAENDKIVAFILIISNATVYHVYPIIALGLSHNGTMLLRIKYKIWAHQKEGKWQTIDMNACIVHEQKGFICESNTPEAQDICLDTEQNICHFERHPN
ncbi:Protein NYNRIN [Aix galericulata]|nr:Protein NYNRIN [Aix galericulata]